MEWSGGGEGKEGSEEDEGTGRRRVGEGRGGEGDEGKIQLVNYQHSIVQDLHGEPQQSLVPSLRPLAPSVSHSYHQIIITHSNEGKERGEDRRGGGAYLWFVKNCNL